MTTAERHAFDISLQIAENHGLVDLDWIIEVTLQRDKQIRESAINHAAETIKTNTRLKCDCEALTRFGNDLIHNYQPEPCDYCNLLSRLWMPYHGG
jgi:hypothetical protein